MRFHTLVMAVLCVAVLVGGKSSATPAKHASKGGKKRSSGRMQGPYSSLAAALCADGDSDNQYPQLADANVGEAARALERLSRSQKALKLTDGAAHQFNTVYSDSKTSLTARHQVGCVIYQDV